jgi:plasmid stabilization system protein ParE
MKQFPRIGVEHPETGTHRVLLNRFPFALVYRVVDDEIIIYAVTHAKKKPRYWKQRLRRYR